MSSRKIFVICICLILFSFSSFAAEKPAISGKYTTLPGQQFKFDGKQVEIIEFLSFYCGHCYHFEKSIPVIKGNFPGKIIWKTIPIYWGNGSPKPGEAYFLAEEAGKGEQMKKAIFNAIFVEKKDIGNIDVLEEIAAKIGLGFDFSMRLRNGDKAGNVGEALLMANNYNINETPAIIIAGNLKTSPGMFKDMEMFKDNTITILKSLFAK